MGRPVLRTPLCDLLGIEYPIIVGGGGGPALEPHAVEQRYWDFVAETVRDLHLSEPASQQSPHEGPFTETPYAAVERQKRHIQAIISERPAVFAAGLGSPKPYVDDLQAAGITICGLVG